MTAADLLKSRPYAPSAAEKRVMLLDGLNELTVHHRRNCVPYDRIVKALFNGADTVDELSALPWLPVRLFKRTDLVSVQREKIVKTLVSSGTTGQLPSRIFLDRETASSQARILATIAGDFLGKARMPMLIIDDASFLRDRTRFNARAAAILGFSSLGRDHLYLLDEQLLPDWDALSSYLEAHRDTPILLFGFTFIVWQNFVETARAEKRSFQFPRGSALIHGGGWKRLEERKVSEESFKAALAEQFGIERVHNYYGMVEQVGSIYFECEHGRLHTPAYSDILIRDPVSLEPLGVGEAGLVQVLSVLPRSYPGHSLLTEDLGTIIGEDDCPCGRNGKSFRIQGRLRNVEMRGCSDTRPVLAA